MPNASTIVLAAAGLLAVAIAVALCAASPSWAIVVGPLRTPHLAAGSAVLGAGLLVIAFLRALAGARSGSPRAWSTLLADGASALAVIGLICWTALIGAGLALSTSGDRVRAVPGAGDRLVEEQDRSLSAHGWEREGTRHGPVVVWGPWRPDDRR